jgi:hypothetical protein
MVGQGPQLLGPQLVVAQVLSASQSDAPFGNDCSHWHDWLVHFASHCAKLAQAGLVWQARYCAEQKDCSQLVQSALPPAVVPDEGEVVPEDALEPLDALTL